MLIALANPKFLLFLINSIFGKLEINELTFFTVSSKDWLSTTIILFMFLVDRALITDEMHVSIYFPELKVTMIIAICVVVT